MAPQNGRSNRQQQKRQANRQRGTQTQSIHIFICVIHRLRPQVLLVLCVVVVILRIIRAIMSRVFISMVLY